MADGTKVKWACPNCQASANEHGKGGAEKCKDSQPKYCQGFLCECNDDGENEDHGTSFAMPCTEAICHHCGWGGQFPVKPKGLQAWEKKALDAGWAPPAARKKELGLG